MVFSGPISSTPSTSKPVKQQSNRPVLNPESSASLVILFVLDEDENNVLLESETNYLPCVQIGGTVSSSNDLPFLVAHKLLDLENLVFKELIEVRLHQNFNKLPDYVLFYQELNLPITAEPRYTWTPINKINNKISSSIFRPHLNNANSFNLFTKNNTSPDDKKSNDKLPYSPEISYLIDNHFRKREEKNKMANLSKLSSRSVSPRPKNLALSPTSQHSNSSLMAEFLNDDSCGEWCENEKNNGETTIDNGIHGENNDAAMETNNNSDSNAHSLQYTDLLVQSNVKNTFMYQIATWQYNRPESIFIRKKLVKKLKNLDKNKSSNPCSESTIDSNTSQNEAPSVSTFTENITVISPADIPKLFNVYTTASFPSLYLKKSDFIKFFNDKKVTINSQFSNNSVSNEASPKVSKTYNSSDSLNRVFDIFNREFKNTPFISFLDFSTCCQLLSPAIVGQTDQHKTARLKVIARFYSDIDENPAENITNLEYTDLGRIIKNSFEMVLKKEISDDEVKKHISSIYKLNETDKTIDMDKFLGTSFRQISSLLKFNIDPITDPLPQLGSKRNSTVAELSFSNSNSTIINSNDSKRVRFGESDATEVSENLKGILTLTNNSAINDNKPLVKKRPYRLATHCLTIHDGRIAHDKTQFIYDIGRGENELAEIDIDQEPRFETDDIPLPFKVAKTLHDKTEKAKAFIAEEEDKENSKPGKGAANNSSASNKKADKNMMTIAERNLTVNTFCHYKSVLCHGQKDSAAHQLLDGLRYFERRHRATNKMQFQWDDQVDMDAFGKCAIQVIRNAKNIFMAEDRCLRIKSPAWVMGDLHGNYPNLYKYEQCLWKMGLQISTQKFLFLGDYVDRGDHGIEVVFGLLAQKVICKDKIFLIRGNHELRNIQKYFSFNKECKEKFGDRMGAMIWEEINKAFDNLPIAAVVDDQIFCVHGGIPRPSVLSDDTVC